MRLEDFARDVRVLAFRAFKTIDTHPRNTQNQAVRGWVEVLQRKGAPHRQETGNTH